MILPHAKHNHRNFCRYSHLTDSHVALLSLINHVRELENMKELSPIKVLVVEDTEICQKIALFMLSQPSYLTDLAVSGKEALAKYSRGYDVILMDLGLPDISGLDVCRHIREKIGDRNIPIIAYSANSDSLFQECLEAGFSQVLLKPTERRVLDQIIKNLVDKK